MNKKQKKMLVRIICAAVMTVILKIADPYLGGFPSLKQDDRGIS